MEGKRKVDSGDGVKKITKNVNFPKFLLKQSNRTRTFFDLSNLMLWICSDAKGKMPGWIFVQVRGI